MSEDIDSKNVGWLPITVGKQPSVPDMTDWKRLESQPGDDHFYSIVLAPHPYTWTGELYDKFKSEVQS